MSNFRFIVISSQTCIVQRLVVSCLTFKMATNYHPFTYQNSTIRHCLSSPLPTSYLLALNDFNWESVLKLTSESELRPTFGSEVRQTPL